MSVVHLYAEGADGASSLVDVLDERIIVAHSKTIRNAVAAMPPAVTKDITITGAAPAALRFVTSYIKTLKRKEALHLQVRPLPLIKAIAIYQAVEALQVEPAQPHVEGHIIGYTSHMPITA